MCSNLNFVKLHYRKFEYIFCVFLVFFKLEGPSFIFDNADSAQ